MSNYFQILNRLEASRSAVRGAESRAEEEAPRQVDESPVAEATLNVLPFPELPLASRETAYAGLLDNLRARTATSALPCVAVAGITAADTVGPVVAGLAAQAEKRSLRLLLGELAISRGRRLLRRLEAGRGGGATSAEGSEPFECGGKPIPEALKQWLAQAGTGHDLVLVAAPPLDASIDTALLAKAGDGLVLVVRPFVTPRAALVSAVEKARTAGCPILGQVMLGTKKNLPRWLQLLIDTFTGSRRAPGAL